MKNRKEKRVGIKYLNKRNTVLGLCVLLAYFQRTLNVPYRGATRIVLRVPIFKR